MIRLGIIGMGVGAYHADAVKNNQNAEIAAICDTDEAVLKKYAQMYPDAKAVSDYREILKDSTIDGVCIATPDNFHCEMVCASLKAGKHVLCEKPLGLHSDECKIMIEESEKSDKLFMVGQVCRETPGFVLAKEIIDSGMIGELYFMESEYAHDYTDIRGWRMDPELMRHPVTGGGCHAVDLLRWLSGQDPVEAFSYSAHKSLTEWPCDDTTIALMKFDEGLSGKVFVSTGCKRDYTMRTAVYGTKGTIVVNNTQPYLSLYLDSFEGKDYFISTKMRNVEHRIPVEQNNHNFKAEIDEFCNCIVNLEKPSISAREGARTVAVCEAIILSSETGKAEKINY